ncbi:mercuric reductase [Chroococcidiopsis sp. CCALA 051]|uniref:dihydrolipoyl dehydrogenase family protein n=1 Tax=Chroococcidiopsis sp. CCALA 051 TaxID=869949 RepID=UPI000D0DC4AD|nr:NAD(P)/FAD-dependent oxidoreductase [Chroococcidiopsis sp. CCALA 051]MBE9019579.1 NAD(P)/FAD-dependent oxidoreductase [Chroococcidiopsidales cyanobacterium LEGE 13417]PSM49581.1 mercuric reductase [Chroococcidiopsis sp. CCALA 051]
MADYDIVIIGGSPAGRYAAAIAAKQNATVALVEREQGAIQNSKFKIQNSKFSDSRTGGFLNPPLPTPDSLSYIGQLARQWEKMGNFGLRSSHEKAIDDCQISVQWERVMQWAQNVESNLAEENSPAILAALGVDFILGQGKFVAQPNLGFVVNNRCLTGRKYLIATNPRPIVPDIEGLAVTGYLTAAEVLLSLTSLNPPKRWAILGGDPNGCQLAQTLTRLGFDITLIVKRPQILPREDLEIAQLLQAILEAEGVRVLTHTTVTQVKGIEGKKWVQADREAMEFDEIVLCAGQQPELEQLNLAAVGVKTQRDRLRLNQKLQTTNSRIYACGDAIGGYQFAHIANYEAKIALQNALQNALFSAQYRVDYRNIPWLVCTDPPLARVGFTAAQAKQKYGNDVLILQHDFKTLALAQIRDEMTGICQLVLRRNGTILGAAIIGSQAGELINVIALAIAQKLKIDSIAALVSVYPSWGEILAQTASEYLSTPLGQKNWLQNLLAKIGCRV